MAYQGRKVWSAGDVLTASDMNSTVVQTVMVFDDDAARTTAIAAPTEGMITYLKSDNNVYKYTGSAWTNIQISLSLTADRAVITDGSGNLAVSDVTATEITYLDGVTSSIQDQLDTPTSEIVTDATTSRTLTASDAGKIIRFTSASAITVTINASTDLPAGQRIDIIQDGAGVVTITADAATVAAAEVSTTTGSFTIGDQYSAATVLGIGSDSYRLIGNISAV